MSVFQLFPIENVNHALNFIKLCLRMVKSCKSCENKYFSNLKSSSIIALKFGNQVNEKGDQVISLRLAQPALSLPFTYKHVI